MSEVLSPETAAAFLQEVKLEIATRGLESNFATLMALYEFDLQTEASISNLYLVGLSVVIAQEAGNPSLLGATEEFMETLDSISKIAERFLEEPQPDIFETKQ